MPRTIMEFYVVLFDPVPPSVNNMYSTGHKGQRFLTTEGRAFKDALTKCVAQEIVSLDWKRAVEEVYLRKGYVRIAVGLGTQIFNQSWKPGAYTASGELQSPYKKIDDLNYTKSVCDAVADATGIDDSCNLHSRSYKIDGKKMIEVFYEVVQRDP